MQVRLFAVTITGPDGIPTHHHVEAADEEIAKGLAVIAAGAANTVGITVTVSPRLRTDPDILPLPPWGWMITATTPNGRVVEQQFLVALEDPEGAMEAARARANPDFVLAVGPRVDISHLVRRKMKHGDAYELGLQRIGRGKKSPK